MFTVLYQDGKVECVTLSGEEMKQLRHVLYKVEPELIEKIKDSSTLEELKGFQIIKTILQGLY